MVPRVVPNGGFECDRHPLIVDFSRMMVGCPLTPFFAYEKGESKLAFKSGRWIDPGSLAPSPSRRWPPSPPRWGPLPPRAPT